MRNLICLTTIFLSLTCNLKAATTPVLELNSSTIKVTLNHNTIEQRITLKDANGIVLFTSDVAQKKIFSRYFDFSQVNNGVYFLETESKFDIEIIKIRKDELGVSLEYNTKKVILKPRIKVDKNKIAQVMLVSPAKSKVDIRIEDSNGDKLFQENIDNNNGVIKKSYDLHHFPSGVYYIYFQTKDQSFVKEINI